MQPRAFHNSGSSEVHRHVANKQNPATGRLGQTRRETNGEVHRDVDARRARRAGAQARAAGVNIAAVGAV